MKIFTIITADIAYLSADLALAPKQPKYKFNTTKVGLDNIRRLKLKYEKEIREWKAKTTEYKIAGYKKESGIRSIVAAIGKEVEAEESKGIIYIHKIHERKVGN